MPGGASQVERDGGDSRFGAGMVACTLVLVAMACLRAIVAFEPLPYFSGDPFVSVVRVTALTPAHGLWLDVAAIVVGGIGLCLHLLAGGRVRPVLVGLVGIGSIVPLVVWSAGLVGTGATIDGSRQAFGTVAALWTAAALAHLCEDNRRRSMALGLALGVVAMLMLKGLVQVLVEHPDTVAWYERDRAGFLAERGWEPDSPQARGYERRLYQAEATGWFGLSNVLATFAAGAGLALAAIGSAGLTDRARSKGDSPSGARLGPGPIVLVLLGATVGVVALLMSRSKGGVAAGGAGAAFVAAMWFVRARLAGHGSAGRLLRRAGVPIAVALALLPMLAVVIRGLLGERIGELSLLFRWFYMQGAARIVADNPLVGVGPAGFRDAYMLVKPPLAVEDVVSPHALSLDLLSAYGVGAGLCWLGAIVLLVATAVASELGVDGPAEEERTTPTPPRGAPSDSTLRLADDTRLLALAAILPTIAAAFIERVLTTPEAAVMRLAGLAGWIGIAWGVMAIARRAPLAVTLGALALAGVLILHSGIETTPIWSGAQPLFFAMLGIAGAKAIASGGPQRRESKVPQPRRVWPIAIGVVTLASLALAPWPVFAWQAHLRRASDAAAPIGQLRQDMRLLATDPAGSVALGISLQSVAADLAILVGEQPARDQATFDRQLAVATLRAADAARPELEAAGALGDFRAARASTRARQHAASSLLELGRTDEALGALRAAVEAARTLAEREDSAQAWSHAATMRTGLGDLLESMGRTDEARADLESAAASHARAAGIDPWGVYHPVRLARLYARLGDPAEAGRWAQRALVNHANGRLDPVAGLTDAEKVEMERLANP
ncbi:MAG: tetratricopeptide repeat protein [Phycisphaerales bacterium]|nr:tetratricopeptide repeat protein [Phycisphaerales bacterium]